MRFRDKTHVVHILASKPRRVLYIGFTGDLVAGVYQHKHEVNEGFTKRYHVKRLVYYEMLFDPMSGIGRGKQLKKWNRAWKIHLVEKRNPGGLDLCIGEEILPLPVE